MSSRQARYKKRKPWVRLVEYARRRCNAPEGSRWWPHYGSKGIVCRLTAEMAEFMWRRDGGSGMKKPTLDRRVPALGYTFSNCRIMEHGANCARTLNEMLPDTGE